MDTSEIDCNLIFSDPLYISKHFKMVNGVTPQQYRIEYQLLKEKDLLN